MCGCNGARQARQRREMCPRRIIYSFISSTMEWIVVCVCVIKKGCYPIIKLKSVRLPTLPILVNW